MVTRAMPGERKSIVAGNFAAICAPRRQPDGTGRRRPPTTRLSSMFDFESGARGLSEVVAGVQGAGEAKTPASPAGTNGAGPQLPDDIGSDMRQPMASLVFLPAGRTPPNPERALTLLAHTNVRVLDVVVNKVPRRAVPYYYNGYGEEGADAPTARQSRKSWRPRLRSSSVPTYFDLRK